MKKWMILSVWIACIGGSSMSKAANGLDYGQFSVSLNVKDIQESYRFYETLGFKKILGDLAQKWIILTNNSAVIGLFEDQIESNYLTFNPKDVRSIYRELKTRGIRFDKEPQGSSGPAYAMFKDPDGNVILLDQHN